MRSLSVSFAVLAVALGANAQFMINTPTLVQCQPSLLSWTGGEAPYFLSVEPGGQPTATPIEDLGQQNGTSLTWLVNIAAGQSVSFNLRDSTGTLAQTAPVTIQASTITSCLGSSGSSSAASSGSSASGSSSSGAASSTPSSPASSSSSPPASSPAPVSTPTGSTSTPRAPSSSVSRPTSAGSSSSTSPSTTPTSGASAKVAHVGFAGAVAVALAAFIA